MILYNRPSGLRQVAQEHTNQIYGGQPVKAIEVLKGLKLMTEAADRIDQLEAECNSARRVIDSVALFVGTLSRKDLEHLMDTYRAHKELKKQEP